MNSEKVNIIVTFGLIFGIGFVFKYAFKINSSTWFYSIGYDLSLFGLSSYIYLLH